MLKQVMRKVYLKLFIKYNRDIQTKLIVIKII